MSYPDPPPPPSFTFFPYGGGEFLPPTQPFKRQRSLENNELNPAPFPPMNPRVNLPTLQGKGTRHMFYKTRVCLKYLEGNCRNGEHCTFAHGAEDLREPPPNWQDLVREKDRGSGSWKDDMNQRVKICNKFYIGEECPYGENCNYVHERPPNFKSDMAKDQRESLAITIGTTDSDELSFWKTRLCRKYEITGQCPFGEKCNYAHGQSGMKLMYFLICLITTELLVFCLGIGLVCQLAVS